MMDHLLEVTRTLCPDCLEVVDGTVVERDGKVYMRRRCKTHGFREGIVSGDAAIYREAAPFNKPGTMPVKFGAPVKNGCPYDCGLCSEHKQHTCLALVEITNACNMRCPTCFASSGAGDFKDLGTIEKMIETFTRHETRPEVLMISGGEPTIHPGILDVVELARAKGVRWVVVNTNGKRLAREIEFAEKLAKLGCWLYLQFDGFKPETGLALRGEADLIEDKHRALENCAAVNLPVIAVMTVEEGVNDDEIGAVCEFVLRSEIVKGVCYQPVFHAGRHDGHFNPMTRITLADVVHRLVDQTHGTFRVKDFIPDPCPYPTCGSTTYVYANGGDLLVLPRLVDVHTYLNYAQNRTVPDAAAFIRAQLEQLFSAGALPTTPNIVRSFCDSCGLSMVEVAAGAAKRLKMIKIKPFMDAWTFDLKRIMKCCVHEATADGKLVPFCAWNNIPMYRAETLKK
jgi:uncharacterized radical SAM superfamily Fe-S cluster-containing enzyme